MLGRTSIYFCVLFAVVVIYDCLKEAYTHNKSDLPLFTWAGEAAKSNHMFKYWLLIMKFQMDFLIFIRSLWEGHFILFVNVLKSLVKWFFIFDQYNYARWITVHIQDLLTLSVTCPQVYQEFIEGKFVVQISNKEFSRIHYDHAHEQSNKTIKSISGPINFVNRADDDLQRRWEVAGLEVAEYIEDVEQKILKDTKHEETNCHHEDNPSHNKMFLNDRGTIMTRLLPINPFLEGSLVKVGTNLKYSEKVHDFIEQIPEIGQKQYEQFVDSRLIKCQQFVSDKIKKTILLPQENLIQNKGLKIL